MSDTIFHDLSLDRYIIRWEEHLGDLTPVENHQGIWFKRDDMFAPLGYGGPNGSKMRQLIWYMNKFREGKTHVLSGASIQSPQLLMSAIVGRHFGLPSRLVVYSKPETLLRHPSPRISAGFGAHFEYVKGPYNPIIQRRVEELARPDSLVVHYGITVDHRTYDSETVRKFHEVGANQTRNIPDSVETLIFPAGSCNSICSLILGLSRDPKNIRKVFAVQIGPDKREWLAARLKTMGVDIEKLPFQLMWYSLHDTGFASYSDHIKESFDGIDFHPVYEGKIIRYLKQDGWINGNDKTLFWIVGSAPNMSVCEKYFIQEPEEAVV